MTHDDAPSSTGRRPGRSRRGWAMAGTFVAFTAVATGVGLVVVQLVDDSVVGDESTAADVTVPPAPSNDPTDTPSPSSTSSPTASTPAVSSRTFASTGGSVTVSCSKAAPKLRTYAPASGYRVQKAETQQDEVEVEFVSTTKEVSVEVTCSPDGRPSAETDVDLRDDD